MPRRKMYVIAVLSVRLRRTLRPKLAYKSAMRRYRQVIMEKDQSQSGFAEDGCDDAVKNSNDSSCLVVKAQVISKLYV